ncbi:MAG: 50S ribosomal protein L21 [Actinomycetota bacterium]|nr:50S ribosomal protein L21 [Actinomycetota bacterium]
MYAVVSTGGKQLKVEKGTVAVVEKIDAEVGDTVALDVLFVADGDEITTDPAALTAATVTAEVVEHFKGEKAVVFKFKKRKGYKRLKGHRQQQTRILVTDIVAAGGGTRVAKAVHKAPSKAAPKAEVAPKVEKAPKVEAAPKTAEKLALTEVAESQCAAVKASGERCANKAKEGSKYCGVHAKKYEG